MPRGIITSFMSGLLFAALLGLAWPAQAANYALLVGVGRYAFLQNMDLDGPPHDARALGNLLRSAWGFRQEGITTLLDEKASKQAILGALRSLAERAGPGDNVLVYFSGHGTSAFDPGLGQGLGMEAFSGALVPADYRHAPASRRLDRLILGDRDLKPIFRRMDQGGARVLVAFDSCFSGQAVRSVYRSAHCPPVYRFLPLADLAPSASYVQSDNREPPYPYRNVIYLAAAGRKEMAEDITAPQVARGKRTFDGRPHGAMTDALLRALAGQADRNRDGSTTHRELYQYVRQTVASGFLQTPRMLAPRDNPDLLDEPVFGKRGLAAGRPRQGGPLRVRLVDAGPETRRAVAAMQGVKLVGDDSAEVVLLATGDSARSGQCMLACMASGFPVSNAPLQGVRQVTAFLQGRLELRRLAAFQASGSVANVFVDVIGPNGVFSEGDVIGFTIRFQERAYPMVLTADPAGMLRVIYPQKADDVAPLDPGRELRLPDLGVVLPPVFGTELVKVLALREPPPRVEGYFFSEFSPTDPLFHRLMDHLRQGWAVGSSEMLLKTAPKVGR